MSQAQGGSRGLRGRHNRAWIMLALVLGVAGVAMVMERGTTTPETVPPELVGEPDVYMEGAVISQFRTDGTLRYRIAADEVRHFERDSVTRLSGTRLTLFDSNQPPWQASARQGYVRRSQGDDDEEVVSLLGDVELEQTRPGGGRIRLTTPSLHLYPNRQYAETDQDVMIDSEVGRTTGTGLEGELQRGLLRLFSASDSHVHSILLPGQFK